MTKVRTLTGLVRPEELGRVLCHEHIVIGMPGWEADTLNPSPNDREVVSAGIEMMTELKNRGVGSIIDPLPANMGRRLDLSAEVSARAGVNVIAATGLFVEKYGASTYWIMKFDTARAMGKENDYVRYLADVFVNEIENGVGPAKLRCGIIKVASALAITPFEEATLKAAALAAIETGVPITTHSDDGLLGAEQQRCLLSLGVPAHRIVIGHSCNTINHSYHRGVVGNGSYIAFDRFGYQMVQRDEDRIDALMALIEAGGLNHILISNDACMCWRDSMQPEFWREVSAAQTADGLNSLNVTDVILPELRRRGVSEQTIDAMMIDNPQRLFSEAELPSSSLSGAIWPHAHGIAVS